MSSSTDAPAEAVVFRPRRLLVVCRLAAGALVLIFGLVALLLPGRQAGTEAVFGPADQIAFFGIGLLLAWAALQFTRVRVTADERQVRIRSYVGERVLPWEVVAAVRLDEGASWASLELHDDDLVALLAIQTNDGERAVDAVVELRRLLAASRAAH